MTEHIAKARCEAGFSSCLSNPLSILRLGRQNHTRIFQSLDSVCAATPHDNLPVPELLFLSIRRSYAVPATSRIPYFDDVNDFDDRALNDIHCYSSQHN